MRYPALMECAGDGYGVTFPDLPGCVAMGRTLDDAFRHGEEALSDWASAMEELGHPIPEPSDLNDVEVPSGCALTSMLMVKAQRAPQSGP